MSRHVLKFLCWMGQEQEHGSEDPGGVGKVLDSKSQGSSLWHAAD